MLKLQTIAIDPTLELCVYRKNLSPLSFNNKQESKIKDQLVFVRPNEHIDTRKSIIFSQLKTCVLFCFKTILFCHRLLTNNIRLSPKEIKQIKQ